MQINEMIHIVQDLKVAARDLEDFQEARKIKRQIQYYENQLESLRMPFQQH